MNEILLAQAHAVAAMVESPASRPTIRLRPGRAETFGPIAEVLRQLPFATERVDTQGDSVLTTDLRTTAQLQSLVDITDRILAVLRPHGTDDGSGCEFDSFIALDELSALADRSLRDYHYSSVSAATDTQDELVFLTAHLQFEAWFPAALAFIDDAVNRLMAATPEVAVAAEQIGHLATIMRFFRDMIELPLIIGAAPYLRFRGKLHGGSGAERGGFRGLEIRLGLRQDDYLTDLRTSGLLTPQLHRSVEQPSLQDAVYHALMVRNVFGPSDTAQVRVQAIARMLQEPGRNADLALLIESSPRNCMHPTSLLTRSASC